jgi:hypothetical protein
MSLINMEEFQKCVIGSPSSEEYEHPRHKSRLVTDLKIILTTRSQKQFLGI